MDDWVDVIKPADVDLPIRSATFTASSDVSVKFYDILEKGALQRLEASKSAIFHVELEADPVYTIFVKNLSTELQKEYTCSACMHFTSRYGDLALVNDDGTLMPLLWCSTDLEHDPELRKLYGPAVEALQQTFIGKRATTEFKVTEKTRTEGKAEIGKFSHMHIEFPLSRVQKVELAGFTSANTPELASMLERVLADYKLGTVRKVYQYLAEHQLPYASNHVASAKWLLELVEMDKIGKAKGPDALHNLRYRYAASSFVGSLKQMRSGALATLLEAVKENRSWKFIQDSWRSVCNPTIYMRPTAAPSEGNIKAAERLFEQLGLTREDLRRRLLVQDDVPDEVIIWASESMKKRKPETAKKVFGDVKAKNNAVMSGNSGIPGTRITFARLITDVLPRAKKIQCWLGLRDHITTMVTGLEGTKPLMQWHDENGKNLASHYLWTTPPPVESHQLKSNAWNDVRCLIPFPHLWDGAPLTTTFPLVDPLTDKGNQYQYYHKQKGFRYCFVLDENHETNLGCLPLFPELLKSEFHGVRSTVEAFTKNEGLIDVPDGMTRGGFVGGVEASRDKLQLGITLRVTTFEGDIHRYDVSRFE